MDRGYRNYLSAVGGRGDAVTAATAPVPGPPPQSVPMADHLAEIASLPLPDQLAAFEIVHRDLVTRLRGSEL